MQEPNLYIFEWDRDVEPWRIAFYFAYATRGDTARWEVWKGDEKLGSYRTRQEARRDLQHRFGIPSSVFEVPVERGIAAPTPNAMGNFYTQTKPGLREGSLIRRQNPDENGDLDATIELDDGTLLTFTVNARTGYRLSDSDPPITELKVGTPVIAEIKEEPNSGPRCASLRSKAEPAVLNPVAKPSGVVTDLLPDTQKSFSHGVDLRNIDAAKRSGIEILAALKTLELTSAFLAQTMSAGAGRPTFSEYANQVAKALRIHQKS